MSRRVLSLALKITGEAQGLRLNSVERALKRLGEETDRVGKVFDKFGKDSEAGARAQAKFAEDSERLTAALKAGTINSREYAAEFAKLAEAANKEAAALERAARITEANQTNFERFTRTQRELREQVEAGRISQETYTRALEGAARGLTDAERAAAGLAARIQETDAAAAGTTLKFNELSGVFAVLPGPLGAIAGRISGIASASEGLSRVFAGGLSQGIAGVTASFRSLVSQLNPATAAIAGFAAAATGIGTALDRLEGRVENLGNLATRLGVSFEFIQILEDAAKRSGSSVDSVAFAFTRLQRTLAGADEESKKVVRALNSVGLAVDDITGKSPEEQYKVIGQALLQIEDPAKRSAAAIELFGRAGATLLPFFNNLPKAERDFRKFGDGINELDKARIDDFGEAIDGLNRATTRLGEVALTPFAGLAEGITKVAAQFVNAITAVAEVVGKLLTPALDQIGVIVGVASEVLGGLAVVFRTIAGFAEPFGKFILPAIVAQITFLNRQILVGAIGSLSRAFSSAAVASGAFSGAASAAAIATRALGAAVRGLLASTGIGVLVVVAGFVADSLLGWSAAAKEAADASEEAGKTAATEAEKAREAYRKQEEAAKEAAAARERQIKEEIRSVQTLVDRYQDLQVIERRFGGDRQRFEAAQRVALIEREIVRTRQEQIQALANGQAAEASAARSRIALLENVLRAEENVASGRAREAEEQAKRADALVESERRRTQAEAENIQKIIDKFKEQQQIQRDFDGNSKRFEASRRVAEVEEEITRLGKERNAALLFGEQQQADSIRERLTVLKQILEQEREIASGRAAQAAEAQKIAEQDRKRVDELLRPADVTRKIREDLQAVSNEIVAAQQRIFDATSRQQRQAAQQELQELQRLEQDLTERVRAVAAGFGDGFDSAFDRVQQNLRRVVEQAETFGDAGEAAARKLEAGIAAAQQKARDGILNRESFDAEVARRQQLFDKEIEQVRQVAEERRRVNEFVDQQIQLARFGGDQQRLQAAERAAQLEKEIGRVQAEVQKARADGDKDAVNAGIQRLAQLDQVAAKERDIASGRLKAEQEIAKQREDSLKKAQEQQKKAQQEQQRAQEEQAKAAAAEFDRQQKRVRALNSIGQQAVSGGDLRTQAGASQFIQAAAGAFDPNLAELRAQSKLLRQIVQNSGALQFLERGIGSTFQFLGGGA